MTRELTGWFEPDRVRLGDHVRWQGARYEIAAFAGPQVTLAPVTGEGAPVTCLYQAMVAAEDFAVLDSEDQPQQPAELPPLNVLLQAASKVDRKQALWWHRHMKEIDTGLRPGHRVPRPGYDPGSTTLAQRYQAKSAELAAADIHIKPRALEDKRLAWKRANENPLVLLLDGRKGKTPKPGGRTDARLITLMHEAVAIRTRESGGTIGSYYDTVQDLLASRYAKELEDPEERKRLTLPESIFYKRMSELGLSDQVRGTTRQRASKASKPLPPYTPSFALQPGELMQMDTTPLHVKALGDDGAVISAEATGLIDVASRTVAAIMIIPAILGEASPGGPRIGGRATKSIDLVMTLAQCFSPMPTRPGWSPLTAAAVSALPFANLRAADARFTEATAARPVIHPRTIIVDQGSPYVSEHFESVCDFLGISLRYARKGTPTDKPLGERFFPTLADRFSQYIPGWTGRSHQVRGRGIERQPLCTINELQECAEEWVALEYQQTPHDGLRSPFLPGRVLSPNEMYAHLVAMTGYRPRPLSPEDSRHLLIPAWVKVTDKGIQIENRTYQNPKGRLRALAGLPSGLAERNDRWQAAYDPYRPEVAWLYDHRGKGDWIRCEFIHAHLLTNPWTQYMWDECRLREQEAGRAVDEIALALALRERRVRSRKGPGRRTGPIIPFQGRPLDVEDATPEDPYANLPQVDLDTITAYPSLPVPGRDVPPTPTAAHRPDDTAAPAPAPDPYLGLADIDLSTITAFPDSSITRRPRGGSTRPAPAVPPPKPPPGDREAAAEPGGPAPGPPK
ncbi:transposase [Kitasatospora sp. NPDC059463]|uniref:transposase n=1 Tax=unclassified Kitasatospora TaxID=2633591 RepID=UPI00367C9843